MSKKVLYVSPNGYLGGAERFVLNACIGHLKYGKDQPYILFFNDGELVNIVKEQGIPYYILKNKFKFSSPIKLWRAIKETKGFLEANDFDVINLTMPYSQLFMNLVKKRKKSFKYLVSTRSC